MYANSCVRECAFILRISAQLRTLWRFKNKSPGVHGSNGDIFLGWSFEVGKKIFKKTLKKMFENEVHCFLTTQCFQLLSETFIWPFTISPNGDGGGDDDDDETACRRSESSEFLQYCSIATRKCTYGN